MESASSNAFGRYLPDAGVQLEVLPGRQKRVDEYHAELADVRFVALCQLLLEAFEHRNDSLPVLGVDLLKDAAGEHANCYEFLKFVVAHGVPPGLGEFVDAAVGRIEEQSPVYLDFMAHIFSPLPFDVLRSYVRDSAG